MVATSPGALSAGDVLDGRFRVEELIGRGGFGAVYRATQLDLGRAVAVKVLLPATFVNQEALSRFRREAELTQRLSHPNTVRLYAYGQAPSGAPYTVWELLNGEGLDALLRSHGPLPPARVARIGEQVLKSLIEAHQAGIVHRDIKPANLFVCQFAGETDFVKVLDFGIAAAAELPSGAQLTREGQTVGTPSYMSPEQVLGEQALDGRSDLYALGLVLAEALVGHVIVSGPTGMRVCIEQMSEAPVPLPEAVKRGPLGSVIERATQKARDRRFANAQEMLSALSALDTANVSALAAPVTTPQAFQPTAAVITPPAASGGYAFGASVVTGTSGTQVVPITADNRAGGARTRTRWWLGVPVLAMMMIGGGVLAVRAPDEPRRTATKAERAGRRSTAHPELRSFKMHGVKAQTVLDRLADRGYEIVAAPLVDDVKGDGHVGVNYAIGHVYGDSHGSVQFHVYDSREDTKLAEDAHQSVFATARDGRRLLMLVIDRDPKRSREVLAEILDD